MKRLVAVGLVVVSMAIPVVAQHGSARGHGAAGPSFHSRSGPTAMRGFAGSPRINRGRSISLPRTMAGRPTNLSRHRPPYRGPYRYRRPYVSIYGAVPYGLAPAPYFLSYPDDFDSDSQDEGQQVGNDEQSYDPGYGPDYEPAQQAGESLPPWPGPAQIAPRQSTRAPQTRQKPESQEAVTLIFKDGRPAEHIRNYLLTKNMLYVGGHHAAIPVDDLDLTATARVNEQAGVDFQLPVASH